MCVHWEEAKVCNGNEQPEILRCAVQVVLRLAKVSSNCRPALYADCCAIVVQPYRTLSIGNLMNVEC